MQHDSDSSSEFQRKLARVCRTARPELIPAVSPQRATVYRDLVFNSMQDTLSRAYPITKSALGESWDKLVNDFVSEWESPSPFLWRMPEELCKFCFATGQAEKLSSPALNDLLRFEWLEIEVYMMPDGEVAKFKPVTDVMSQPLVINPDHKLISFNYPVFKLPLKDAQQYPGSYNLLCFRNRKNCSVYFIELDETTTQFFITLKGATVSTAKSMTDTEKHRAFLEEMAVQGMILGSLDF